MRQPLSIEQRKNVEPKLQLDAQALEFFSEIEETEKDFDVEKANFKKLTSGTNEQCEKAKPENNSEPSSRILSILKPIGETLLPLADDVLNGIVTLLKKVLSPEVFTSVGFFAVSIIGSVLHVKEINATREDVIDAFNDPQAPQRNMRIALGVWNLFLGIAGAAISLGLLACGIAVAAGVALPSFILSVFNPISMGILTAICINRFLVNTDAVDHAKKAEEIAKTTYLNDPDFNDTFFELLEKSKQLEIIWREIIDFRTKEHDKLSRYLLYKINNLKDLTLDDKDKYQTYLDRIDNKTNKVIHEKLWIDTPKIIDINNKIKSHGSYSFQKKRQTYHTCQNDLINAEKKVKYSFIEVIGSIIVFVGIVSGLLPVILFGAAIGISGKITEELNKSDPSKLSNQFSYITPETHTISTTAILLAHPSNQLQELKQPKTAPSPVPHEISSPIASTKALANTNCLFARSNKQQPKNDYEVSILPIFTTK